jgi:hypothetical protein
MTADDGSSGPAGPVTLGVDTHADGHVAAALALRRNATAPPAAMILHARGPVQAARGRAAGAAGGVAARAVLE